MLTIAKAAQARELAVACLAAREYDHAYPGLVRALVGVLEQATRQGELSLERL